MAIMKCTEANLYRAYQSLDSSIWHTYPDKNCCQTFHGSARRERVHVRAQSWWNGAEMRILLSAVWRRTAGKSQQREARDDMAERQTIGGERTRKVMKEQWKRPTKKSKTVYGSARYAMECAPDDQVWLTNTTAARDCQTPSAQNSGRSNQRIGWMAMEGKTLRKGSFWVESRKRNAERSTSGLWSEPDDGKELGDDAWIGVGLIRKTKSYTGKSGLWSRDWSQLMVGEEWSVDQEGWTVMRSRR